MCWAITNHQYSFSQYVHMQPNSALGIGLIAHLDWKAFMWTSVGLIQLDLNDI